MVKFIHAGLMSAVMVVMMCGGVFAQETFVPQGSTLVPYMTFWKSSKYYYWTMVSLSNVTGSDVKCRVTPYNDSGAEVPQYIEVETSTAVIGNGISEFDIPAHSTRYVRIRVKNTKKNVGGYALIEWSSTDTVARRALLGGVRTNGYSWEGPLGGEYLLNNGQPF